VAKKRNYSLFQGLRLSMKLGTGFGVMVLLLVVALGIAVYEVTIINTTSERVVNTRVPTALVSIDMLNGINQSLAGLRGWMLLGKEQFKKDRAETWSEYLDKPLGEMKRLAKDWDDKDDINNLAIIDKKLKLFRDYQQEVEDIANTIDEKPASKILFQDAAPRAAQLSSLITRMIDLEGQQPGTELRKNILYMMADVRGTTGLGLAAIRAYLLSGDESFKKQFDSLWEKNTTRFRDLENAYTHLTPAQRSAFDQFKQVRSEFEGLPPKMFEIRGSAEWNLANFWLATRAAPIAAELTGILKEMSSHEKKLLLDDAQNLEDVVTETINLSWTLMGVSVVAGVLLIILLTRAIAGPILRAVNTIRGISENRDLTIRLPVESSDEIGVMATTLNEMLGLINNTFAEVYQASREVVTYSDDAFQRASGNRNRAEDQLKRAQTSEKVITEMGLTAGQVTKAAQAQQDSAVQSQNAVQELLDKMGDVAESAQAQDREAAETLARVSEMGETSGRVVKTALEQEEMVGTVNKAIQQMVSAVDDMQKAVGQATDYGRSALNAAEEGRQSVAATVDGMRAIAESSEQISEIIGVITEIAEQTNLLALNAAVEAARAGAHGKGFAVVADEVGKLAQRSSEAAKEITQLIKDSTNSVSEGVKLTDKSQQALLKIDEGGRINMTAIEEIATSAEALNSTTGQVTGYMKDLNVLAQKIALMAGESGTRREVAEDALRVMLEYSSKITRLVEETNQSAKAIGQEMESVVRRGGEMGQMTAAQAQRSQAITKLAQETAATAAQTVEGAGIVTSIMDGLKHQSEVLNEQVRQFKTDI